MKHISVFRLIFLLTVWLYGGSGFAQVKFVPGKFVDGNTNPYKTDESLIESFGFKSADTISSNQDRLNAMNHILQKRYTVAYTDSLSSLGRKELTHIFSIASNVYSLKNNRFDAMEYLSSIYYGKWLTSVSGFRVGAHVGTVDTDVDLNKTIYSGNLSVDYIMSLSNYILEYNQNRRLNLNGYVGVAGGLSFVSGNDKGVYFGLRTGLQLAYRISSGVELFVEPGLNIYSDNYNLKENWRKYDLSPVLMAGVTYKMMPKEYRQAPSEFFKGAFMNTFVSLSGGWSNILLQDGAHKSDFANNIGPSFSIALGKWITPVSGIRASFNMAMPKINGGKNISVSSLRADYMLALDPLFEGYNAQKPFKLSLIAGLEAAFPKSNHEAGVPSKYQANGTAIGVGFGINADIRLNDYLSVFVEPRISIYQSKLFGGLTHHKFDVPTNVQVGMTWNPGIDYVRTRFIDNSLDSAKVWSDYIYIAGAIGLDKIVTGNTVDGRSIYSPSASLYLGKRFNSLIGARLGLQAGIPDNQNGESKRGKYINAGVSADVLLNINTLMFGSQNSTWIEVEPYVGYGAHFVTDDDFNLKYVSALRGGLHISKRVSRSTKIFIEPNVKFYSDGYNLVNEGGLDVVPGLQAGISYFIVPQALRTNVGSFESSSFWDNTFLTLGGGFSTIANGTTVNRNFYHYAGPKLNLGIGKWFNEYSGLRLSGSAELVRSPLDKSHIYNASLHADYMFNINSVFNGYDRSRVFSIIGILGLNGALPETYNNNKDYAFGAGAGVQANFKLTRLSEFFIEPRLDLYTSSLYGGFNNNKFDALASLMLGFTFTRDGEYISMKSENDEFNPHCFISVGGGLNAAVSGNLKTLRRNAIQPYSQIAFGYSMTPISTLRVGANAALLGELNSKSKYVRTKLLAADLDYMFNLTNALYGYSQSRRVSASALVGVAAMFNNGESANDKKRDLFAGINAGLNLDLALSSYLSLFVEPKITLTDDKLVTTSFAPLKCDILGSVLMGLKYNMSPVYRDSRVLKMKNETFADNSFYSIGGLVNIMASSRTINRNAPKYVRPGVSVGFGKWFNEYSALRVSLAASILNNPSGKNDDKEIAMFTGSLDYMFNIHSILYGYNPDRIFNMYGIIGGVLALPEKTNKTDFNCGGEVGLQGNFTLSQNTSLYIEPKAGIFGSKYMGGMSRTNIDIPLSLSLGLTFTRNDSKGRHSDKFISENSLSNSFISIGGGVNSIVSGHMKVMGKESFQYIASLGIGKWFNSISALRLSGFMGEFGEIMPKTGKPGKSKLIGLDLDYMMNLTNFICGYSKDRVVNVSGIIGGTALYNTGYTGNGKSNGVLMGAHAGLNASFRLSEAVSLYIEPKLGLYDDRLESSCFTPANSDLWGSAMVGLTYNIKGDKYKKSIDNKQFVSIPYIYAGYGLGSGICSDLSEMESGSTFVIGLEKQYSAISSFRLGYKFSNYPALPYRKNNKQKDIYNGLDVSYLMNFTNLVAGVNDNRIVNVYPVIGASLGAAKADKSMKFAASLNAGLNVSFKVMSDIDIFVEPRVDLGTKHMSQSFNYRPIDMSGCVMIGAKYRFK